MLGRCVFLKEMGMFMFMSLSFPLMGLRAFAFASDEGWA